MNAAQRFYKQIQWGNDAERVLHLQGFDALPNRDLAQLGKAHRLVVAHGDVSRPIPVGGGRVLVDPVTRDLFVVGLRAAPKEAFAATQLPRRGERRAHASAVPTYTPLQGFYLGEAIMLDYTTRKGPDNEPVIYTHEFLDRGEGRPRAKVRPHAVYCPDAPGVIWLVGGDYTVTAHGIVG